MRKREIGMLYSNTESLHLFTENLKTFVFVTYSKIFRNEKGNVTKIAFMLDDDTPKETSHMFELLLKQS
ncbi:MAG: hypothetical protein CMI29_00330 [Opitutae bacterium]|nr:hypothetical protein [Opitutae bacterium]